MESHTEESEEFHVYQSQFIVSENWYFRFSKNSFIKKHTVLKIMIKKRIQFGLIWGGIFRCVHAFLQEGLSIRRVKVISDRMFNNNKRDHNIY